MEMIEKFNELIVDFLKSKEEEMTSREFMNKIHKDPNLLSGIVADTQLQIKENIRQLNEECFNGFLHDDEYDIGLMIISEATWAPKVVFSVTKDGKRMDMEELKDHLMEEYSLFIVKRRLDNI